MKRHNYVGTALATLIFLLVSFCVIRQTFNLALGNLRVGGLYGGRGDAAVYSTN